MNQDKPQQQQYSTRGGGHHQYSGQKRRMTTQSSQHYQKRFRGGNQQQQQQLEPQTELQKQFAQYASMLDEGHERKERIYKASRDVTAESKKVVFLLLRIQQMADDEEEEKKMKQQQSSTSNNMATDGEESATATTTTTNTEQQSTSQRESILNQAKETIHHIAQNYILPIVQEVYVNPQEFYYKYHYQFSFGLQEFIEGVSLYKYLSGGKLVSKEELEDEFLQFENVELVNGTTVEHIKFTLTTSDYILGIADLTGECMRFATNSISTGNRTIAFKIKSFLQSVLGHFLALQHYVYKCPSVRKDLDNKIRIMQSSCYKVEQLCFKLTLQNKEQIFAPIDVNSLGVNEMYDEE